MTVWEKIKSKIHDKNVEINYENQQFFANPEVQAGLAVAGVVGAGGLGGNSPGLPEEAATGEVLQSGTIWRSGKASPGNFVDKTGEGVSMRNSLSNPIPAGKRAVFEAG